MTAATPAPTGRRPPTGAAPRGPPSAAPGRWSRCYVLLHRRPDPRWSARSSGCSWARSSPRPSSCASPPTCCPSSRRIDNYSRLFDQLDFPRFFFNSSVVAVAVTVGNLLFCPMLGYALAKLQFAGKRLADGARAGHADGPGRRHADPAVRADEHARPGEHLPGLILPFLAGPFGVFLMRQFMLGIPDELLEAARIDGAGECRIFWPIAHAARGAGPRDARRS